MGRSGGSRPYRRAREYLHSCAPSSAPFTVDGCTFSQAPVFVARRIRCTPWTGVPLDGCRQGLLRPLGSPIPNHRPSLLEAGQVVRRLELHFPPERYNEVSFDDTGRRTVSGAVSVGSRRANPTCFTGRWATPITGAPSPNP